MAKANGVAPVPALTEFEASVWHAIKKISNIAFATVGKDLERDAAISGSEFGVLSRLEELGNGHLTQIELARSMGWDQSRLSHQITRMEKRGFIRRKVNGRTVKLTMSAAGKNALGVARPALALAVRKRLLAHLTHDEAAFLVELEMKLYRSDT